MAAVESRTASPVAPRGAGHRQARAGPGRRAGGTEALLTEGASYADSTSSGSPPRAGISRTAFYFYFRDKRELLMRLTEEVNELLYAQADIWFSGDGDAPSPRCARR